MPVTSFLLLRVGDIKSSPICYMVKACTLTVPREQESCILLFSGVVIFESVSFCRAFFLTSENLKAVLTFENVLGSNYFNFKTLCSGVHLRQDDFILQPPCCTNKTSLSYGRE